MAVSRRLAVIALAAALAPLAGASADDNAAFSSAPTLLQLCGVGGEADGCKDGSYARQAAELDRALQPALAKAPGNVRPLLKRDQYWFGETLVSVADSAPREKKQIAREAFNGMVRKRVATLGQIAEGFGRASLLGPWVDAFGSVTVSPAEGGAYRLAIDVDSGFSFEDDKRWRCRASALVKQASGGWLAGELVLEPKKPERAGAEEPADDGARPLRLSIRMRRQGATLRVVTSRPDGPFDYDSLEDCKITEQVTSTYFASGKPDAATTDRADTGFAAPTFDCARPDTSTDEEICADPDLAAQDVRLNRAWKALQPRLDDATRRALTEDQRQWVREQAGVYPIALHPGADKTTYDLHHLRAGRDQLDRLQRERVALLEGFDENRKGLAGLWLSHNAVLSVTSTANGGIKAKGQKWEWDDYKAGCDYDMKGKAAGNNFRAGDQAKNPDTLDRDHAMLIVNRQDDVFARKRQGNEAADEMKCRRSMQASSTVRLFPALPSPDIDPTGDWHH
jgi:uncharacterized protein YecT (DUF1311 family)